MKIIVGNQKNYMTIKDTKNFLDNVRLTDNVIICPSNIYIPYYIDRGYKVGLQNINVDNVITGEVSILQAKSLNINYVIVGHSERRNLGETNEIINQKLKSLKDLNVILCIGEDENEDLKEVLENQILNCLKDINIDNIIIAYEPVYAIGTGNALEKEKINMAVTFIKNIIKENYNKDIKVLYGGSINSTNINELNSIEILDGFLVGKSSTDPIEFNKIIEVVN